MIVGNLIRCVAELAAWEISIYMPSNHEMSTAVCIGWSRTSSFAFLNCLFVVSSPEALRSLSNQNKIFKICIFFAKNSIRTSEVCYKFATQTACAVIAEPSSYNLAMKKFSELVDFSRIYHQFSKPTKRENLNIFIKRHSAVTILPNLLILLLSTN